MATFGKISAALRGNQNAAGKHIMNAGNKVLSGRGKAVTATALLGGIGGMYAAGKGNRLKGLAMGTGASVVGSSLGSLAGPHGAFTGTVAGGALAGKHLWDKKHPVRAAVGDSLRKVGKKIKG